MAKVQKTFRPMKAADLSLSDAANLQYPVYVTPKIDGIRAVILEKGGPVLSSTLKSIPNKFIQESLRGLDRFDGELTVGETFQDSTSGIMSEEGEPDFSYHIFDYLGDGFDVGYCKRLERAEECFPEHDRCRLLHPAFVEDYDDLKQWFDFCLEAGHEGLIVRSKDGPYKFGRATEKEGYCFKIKPMEDTEGVIVGFEEQMENGNLKKENELGLTKRSSNKANFAPKGTLGAFIVKSKKWAKEFTIGTGQGLTQGLRQDIWDNRKKYLGEQIKFKYQGIGSVDAPRIPIFLGFRDKRDK